MMTPMTFWMRCLLLQIPDFRALSQYVEAILYNFATIYIFFNKLSLEKQIILVKKHL